MTADLKDVTQFSLLISILHFRTVVQPPSLVFIWIVLESSDTGEKYENIP